MASELLVVNPRRRRRRRKKARAASSSARTSRPRRRRRRSTVARMSNPRAARRSRRRRRRNPRLLGGVGGFRVMGVPIGEGIGIAVGVLAANAASAYASNLPAVPDQFKSGYGRTALKVAVGVAGTMVLSKVARGFARPFAIGSAVAIGLDVLGPLLARFLPAAGVSGYESTPGELNGYAMGGNLSDAPYSPIY